MDMMSAADCVPSVVQLDHSILHMQAAYALQRNAAAAAHFNSLWHVVPVMAASLQSIFVL